MSQLHRGRAARLRAWHQRFQFALNRRQVLRGLSVAPFVSLAACDSDGDAPPPAPVSPGPSQAPSGQLGTATFEHGVASGDPLADGIILWTRATPADPAQRVRLNWEMSRTADFASIDRSGSVETNAERDFTAKIDVRGLVPATTYFYRFQSDTQTSPIGRTRTAPASGDSPRLRFAVCSCSNYSFGFFNGYAAIAQRADLDAVIHLGDYLYETAGGSLPGREHTPDVEIVTLDEYRARFAQYRQDPDLQEAHRQHPFITIWDDHETTNNSYRDGAANHQPETEGDWFVRKGQAVRAYFEWMPIRDNPDTAFDAPEDGLLPEGNGRIFRRLRYGDLVDLILLDTRLAGRVEQNGTTTVTPEQTILGDEQRAWLLDALRARRSQWTVVAQQMTFAPLKVVPLPEEQGGTFLNDDAWDGYRFDRNTVLDTLEQDALENVVILSGDTHVVTAFDVPREPSDPTRYNPITGAGSLAVEFSSNGIANVGIIGEFFMANNPHLKYSNLTLQGYLLLDVDQERAQGEYWFTGVPFVRDATEVFGRALFSSSGSQRLSPGVLPSPSKEDAPPLAP